VIFTQHFKRILVVFSIFCTSLLHTTNVCASDDSSEENEGPPTKKRKLKENTDSNEGIIHIVDSPDTKPSPVVPSNPTLPELDTTAVTSPILSTLPSTLQTPFTSVAPKKITITDWLKAAPSMPLYEEEVIVPKSMPLKDSFYIFNVGQGNSQLAMYVEGPGEAFAVLYDGGTSAETVNSKVLKIQSSNKESKPFLMKKTELSQPSKPSVPDSLKLPLATLLEEKASPEHTTNMESTEGSLESSDNSFSNDADTENPENPITLNIKNTLKTVKNLFVVLSHPDKDHINLIKDSLSTTINVLFILCGNFFAENDKEDLKKDIKELFSFISTRMRSHPAKTHFTFPYFWPSDLKTPYSTLNYQEIKDFLLTYHPSNKHPLGSDTYLPKMFQGNFSIFLQTMQAIDPQNTTENPFWVNFLNDERLQNIYIWLMNQISDNINNHSPVISFRMPNLEKTFICTGDAGPEVFLKIQKKISKQIAIQPANKSTSGESMLDDEPITIPAEELMRVRVDAHLHGQIPYIIMLMLPHHGAEKNLSYSMLDLFAPHVLGISAGAGSMYRHPSTDLIKLYKKAYKEKAHLQKRKKELWEHYELQVAHRYLTFKDEEKTKESKKPVVCARLNRLQETKLPILSTGIAGTINVTKEGFYSQFTDHFQFTDQIYSLVFSEAICIHDPASTKVTDDSIEIIEKGQKFYISPNILKIKYEGRVFKKNEPTKLLGKKVFLSEDGEQLLVSLDIKQKGSDSKSIQKLYLGHKVIIDN